MGGGVGGLPMSLAKSTTAASFPPLHPPVDVDGDVAAVAERRRGFVVAVEADEAERARPRVEHIVAVESVERACHLAVQSLDRQVDLPRRCLGLEAALGAVSTFPPGMFAFPACQSGFSLWMSTMRSRSSEKTATAL